MIEVGRPPAAATFPPARRRRSVTCRRWRLLACCLAALPLEASAARGRTSTVLRSPPATASAATAAALARRVHFPEEVGKPTRHPMEPTGGLEDAMPLMRRNVRGGLLRGVLGHVPVRYSIAACIDCKVVTVVSPSGLRHQLPGHSSAVTGMRFFPYEDRLLTWGDDPYAILWDGATGRRLGTFFHRAPIVSCRPMPGGDRIVTCSRDGMCAVWNASSGDRLHTLPSPKIYEVDAFPSGDRILTWSSRGPTTVWDVRTGKAVCKLPGQRSAIYSARIFPDSTRVVTSSHTTRAIIWDASTCQVARHIHHSDLVQDVGVIAGGETIFTLDIDGRVDTWSARTGERLRMLAPPKPDEDDAVIWVEPFLFDDRVAALNSQGVFVMNSTSGERTVELFESPYIHGFDLAPGGDLAITCGDDGMTVWDANRGKVRHKFQVESEACLLTIGFTRDVLDPDGFESGLTFGDLL